ncbi:KilA-N domain-containing protein [Phlyctema vagabunda]|uniref:KilA-N domain-containing protein n=1 Tax=Phlyctema vagabunda TaxID=108571 RepID=A0ABR4PVT2_9HELO
MSATIRHHQLPARNNELMTDNVPAFADLIARRRLGQTDLTVKAGQVGTSNSTKPKNLGTFDYAHLRAPLPKGVVSGIFKPSPSSYFLMRRSQDGYISATGMFKASFPYAEADEEEQERKYIKGLSTTSTNETAGNIWVPPQHALELAEDYKILPWIQALLDNTTIEQNPTKENTPKSISPPPKFEFLQPQDTLSAPTPSSRARSLRSASPSKIASPKKAGTTRSRKARAPSETPVIPTTKAANKKLQNALKAASAETDSKWDVSEVVEESESKPEAKEEPVVRVNVDTDVETKGDVETTHTHVEVEMPAGFAEMPLPEDTAAMIAKAKEMVEAAVRGTENAELKESKIQKRKVEEVEGDDEDDTLIVAPAKKAKVETELKKERVKTRALIGLSATLAIGAIIPYVMGAF